MAPHTRLLPPGSTVDRTQEASLLKDIGTVRVIADKGYDTDTFVQLITDKSVLVAKVIVKKT